MVLLARDRWTSQNPDIPSHLHLVLLASGLPHPKHTLEISGNDATPIAAIRVYRPAPAQPAR